MADITKINSRRSVVHFSETDLINLDLIRWIKSSFKGISVGRLIQDSPFEVAAAKVLSEKQPNLQIHLAEKCFYREQDNSVDVILRVSEDKTDKMFNHNPIDLNTNQFPLLMNSTKDMDII